MSAIDAMWTSTWTSTAPRRSDLVDGEEIDILVRGVDGNNSYIVPATAVRWVEAGAWVIRSHETGYEFFMGPPLMWRPRARSAKAPAGPAVCSRCKLVNEYAEPSPAYVCFECRKTW